MCWIYIYIYIYIYICNIYTNIYNTTYVVYITYILKELHTKNLQSEINNSKNENLLTLKAAKSFLEEKIKTPEFHLLPKMHKTNNPGRPVISSINCHTNRISEFADYYLQPDVKNLNPMLKTLKILLRKLKP